MKILVLNGPNLNMLGIREPEIYGHRTLDDINSMIKEYADSKGVEVEFYQSNSEGNLIDKIHSAYKNVDGIVFNPAAYTHYSIAIADAIKAVKIPTVEVHLSKISEREEFRYSSVIVSACIGQISGHGEKSYILGFDELIAYLNKENANG